MALSFASRGFYQGIPVFPSPQKPVSANSSWLNSQVSPSPGKINFFLGGGGGTLPVVFLGGEGEGRGERGDTIRAEVSLCMAFSVYKVFHMACLSKHQLPVSDRQAKC